MAMVDGRPAQYGLSLKQLREVMEVRGREACEQIHHYGGVQEICKKLYTSPTEGKLFVFCFNRSIHSLITGPDSQLPVKAKKKSPFRLGFPNISKCLGRIVLRL